MRGLCTCPCHGTSGHVGVSRNDVERPTWNLLALWERVSRVDKRRIEGRLAWHLWNQTLLSLAKITLALVFLFAVGISFAGLAPPEISAVVFSLYRNPTISELVLGGGIAGLAGTGLLLNAVTLEGRVTLFNDALRTAERVATKKSALRARG